MISPEQRSSQDGRRRDTDAALGICAISDRDPGMVGVVVYILLSLSCRSIQEFSRRPISFI